MVATSAKHKYPPPPGLFCMSLLWLQYFFPPATQRFTLLVFFPKAKAKKAPLVLVCTYLPNNPIFPSYLPTLAAMEYHDDLDRVLAEVGPEMAREINAILRPCACAAGSRGISATLPSTALSLTLPTNPEHAVLHEFLRQIHDYAGDALLQLNRHFYPQQPLGPDVVPPTNEVAHEVAYKAVLRVLECLTEGIPQLELLPTVAAKALSRSASNLGGAVRKLTGTIGAREGQKQPSGVFACLARENRTQDGLDVVDDGPLHEFETFPKANNLSKALEGIAWEEAVQQSGLTYWVCPHCQRSTSDERTEHFQTMHPLLDLAAALAEPVRLATKEYVIAEAERITGGMEKKGYPCIATFTMETPLYRVLNQSSREVKKPGGGPRFEPWKPFARMLHEELQSLPKFEGVVFRAIDFKPSTSLFPMGSVITWNQVLVRFRPL